MEKVIINLRDDKGAIQLRVSRETAERLRTDNKYATDLLEQIRAAEHNQVNPSSVVTQPPVFPTPQPPAFTRCPTPIPQPPVSTTPTQVLTQPAATFTRCPTPIPQPPVSTTPTQVRTQPAATFTRCPTPETHMSSSDNLVPCPSVQPECHESQTEFKHKTTLFLLELTRTYRHLYYHNKTAFYRKLEHAFTSKGYTFTNEKIRKKLGNMLTTFKRAKDRSRATGEGNITWEYYLQMNEIFGGSGVGSAPPGTIISTPLFPSQTPQPPSIDDQQPGPSTATATTATATTATATTATATTATQAPGQRATAPKKGHSQQSFHETYQTHAERRTAALESLTRPELARWRRLKERRRRGFEKKMLTCMGEILTQLKEIGKQQEKIIELLK